MRYYISDASHPINYTLCGNLISKDEFLHPRRNIDTYVLILVKEGTLFITQSGIEYEIGANQYIYLIAGEEHFGHRPSRGRLSYLWTHFSLEGLTTIWKETSKEGIALSLKIGSNGTSKEGIALDLKIGSNETSKEEMAIDLKAEPNATYIMPEYGEISLTQRAPLLFNQLLDLSKQEKIYSKQMINYALTLLIMEISQEFFEMRTRIEQNIPPNVARIMEWIKGNYYRQLTVNEIAKEFGYNSDYLSALFKKFTSFTLIHFINKTRVDISKALIVNLDISIKEAAYSCGFHDEKYFMKTFKKYEAMTPSQYKKAFTKKMIN